MVRVLFLSSQWHGTAKRFILSSSVSDELVDRFRQRLAALEMGDPLDASTGVAPMSSVDAAARLDDQSTGRWRAARGSSSAEAPLCRQPLA